MRFKNPFSLTGYTEVGLNNPLPVVSACSYRDLGEVICGEEGDNGYQLLPDTIAVVEIQDNVQWVRNIPAMFKVTDGGLAKLRVYTVDPIDDTIQDFSEQTIECNGNWQSLIVSTPFSILGKRGYVTIKNVGEQNIDVFLRVQMVGG